MNKSKMVLLTMLFSFICMVTTFAQNQRGGSNATPEERAAKMTERMKQSLKLTDEQTAKVQAINLQMANDMATARESGQDMRTSMQTIRAKQDAELQKVLTPEQYKTYLDSRQQMQNRNNGSGGGNTTR